MNSWLQLVEEVVQGRHTFLQTLALAGLGHNLSGLGCRIEGVTLHYLPVVKHTLWEGLATCVGPQVSSEACEKK